MSRYLVDRIHALANVEVVTGATVTGLEGHDGMLQAVRWRLGTTGREIQQQTGYSHLFLFIGADPNTDWLSRIRHRSRSEGFRFSLATMPATAVIHWKRRGVGSLLSAMCGQKNRSSVVAAAVGEGAYVVAALHVFLTAASPIPDR